MPAVKEKNNSGFISLLIWCGDALPLLGSCCKTKLQYPLEIFSIVSCR